MAYSTIPKGSLYMNSKLYTGNGSTQSITGVNFQPDWTWIKNRTDSVSNSLTDIVRGANKSILSNSFDAETTNSSNGYLASFDSDGFTTDSDGDYNNANAKNYVSWNWLANGAGSANTDGSISSTVSANTTSGFSILTYTNQNVNTIGHGLGVVPDVIIAKTLGVSGSWFLGSEKMLGGWNKKLNLNETGAVATETRPFYPSSAAPTSTVFSSDQSVFGAGGSATETMVAYCFAEKQGYSKFGSYTGNGNANGPFVYTGFKPAFFLWKKSSDTGNWLIMDNKRSPINFAQTYLKANATAPEDATSSDIRWDFLSNGLKCRGNNSSINTSSATYIYMAFAENPFVATSGTNAIPVTAR